MWELTVWQFWHFRNSSRIVYLKQCRDRWQQSTQLGSNTSTRTYWWCILFSGRMISVKCGLLLAVVFSESNIWRTESSNVGRNHTTRTPYPWLFGMELTEFDGRILMKCSIGFWSFRHDKIEVSLYGTALAYHTYKRFQDGSDAILIVRFLRHLVSLQTKPYE